MSRSTISTFQLFDMFPDQESARIYLEPLLWPAGPRCPVCGLGDKITAKKGGYYRCRQCNEVFTVRTGTVFERSHVPLHKWVYAMYLVVTARKGISSMQLAKEIGVTQKTAWFVLGRLREACGPHFGKLSGIIEIDEVYVGGLEANKHEHKKLKMGRGPVGKQAVLGMRERGGRTIGVPIPATDAGTITDVIVQAVEVGSTIHTDEAGAYVDIGGLFFTHETKGPFDARRLITSPFQMLRAGYGNYYTPSTESWAITAARQADGRLNYHATKPGRSVFRAAQGAPA